MEWSTDIKALFDYAYSSNYPNGTETNQMFLGAIGTKEKGLKRINRVLFCSEIYFNMSPFLFAYIGDSGNFEEVLYWQPFTPIKDTSEKVDNDG